MELELDFSKNWNWAAVITLTLLAAFGLGAIGRGVTPAGAKLLTWPEWQVLQARQAYHAELSLLRQDVHTLAGLLEQSPDPVRAQLIAGQTLAHAQSGQAMLAAQREAVAAAAEALQAWAVGIEERRVAETALLQAVLALNQAGAP